MSKCLFLGVVVATAMYCTGCSTSYKLTIDSKPQSATLYCSGWDSRTTPVELYYDKSDLDSYIVLPDCYVQWPSGAKTGVPRKMTVYSSGGTLYTAERPNDYPNIELDYQYDFRNKQIQLQNQQLEIQREQLYEMNRMNRPRTTNCHSDNYGNVSCTSF